MKRGARNQFTERKDAGMSAQETFFLRIQSVYESLRNSEQAVAGFLLARGEAASSMKLIEFARAADVSEASVIRFCRRLGYDGYSSMRDDLIRSLAVRQAEKQEHPRLGLFPDTPLHEIPGRIIARSIMVLEATLKMFRNEPYFQAVEAIRRADSIALFGAANSASVADDALNKFVRIGKKCVVAGDSHIQAAVALGLGAGDVAVGISHSGKTRETIDALRLAKSTGATVISLSNNAASLITEVADISLVTADFETDFLSETTASRICQLAIIDMLYLGVLFADYEQNSEHLALLNAELAKHSY